MANDLRNAMRVGIVQFMAYPSTMSGSGPILESVNELVEDEFFDVLEMTHIEDDSIRKEACERIHTAGMDLAYGSQPLILGQKLNLHSPDEPTRKQALDRILAAVEEAVEMGAVGFATMSGTDPGKANRPEETKLFVDSLCQICERARQLNPRLKVVVETFDRVPFGKNCMIGPTQEAVALAHEVRRNYDNFGLMLDLSHLPLLNETPEEALPAAQEVLTHAHVGNCVMKDVSDPYYGDNHPPFDYTGGENAQNELVRYLKCLKDIGYLDPQHPPIVTAEVKPLNDDLRPAAMGNIKRTFNRALAQLQS